MRSLLIALVVLLASGCARVCRPGTVLLEFSSGITLPITSAQVSVSIEGAMVNREIATTKTEGTVEVVFPSGYPLGKSVSFSITLVDASGAALYSAVATQTLSSSCLTIALIPAGLDQGGLDAKDLTTDAPPTASDLAADLGSDAAFDMAALADANIEPDLNPQADASSLDLASGDIASVDMIYTPLTWTKQTSGVTGSLLACSTAGADAWVTGMPAIVIGSTNSGTNWNPITLPAASASPFSVWAVSSSAVYVAGVLLGGQSAAKVYKSTNKVDFTEVYTSLSNELSAIHGPANNLFAVGKSGLVLRSINGGVTWPQQNAPSGTNDVSNVYVAPDGTPFVTVGQFVYRSPDGGSTWLGKKVLPDGATITDISGVDELNLWVVGNQTTTPYVYKTNDSSASWDPVSVPSGPTGLSGVFARSKDEVIIVGAAGALLHFYNGSMRIETSGVSADLNAVCGLGESKYLAVGKSGTLLRGE